ncbi:MAG: orotate phosphoribosyltransferase [Planctomycetota bacterium]|nr:MAG: orotate phosphoribosyltransferase [Planctomycetota bacterium]
MQAYKQEFIEFMVRCGVLTFGDFVTKSGRRTPFFVNTGKYETGSQLATLGRYYAQAIIEHLELPPQVLFGPAYKGIPLVATTSMALAAEHDLDVAFCFDRKEAKDHGEGGSLVGHAPRNGERVLIVEDVTTAGTSVRETVPKLRAAADVTLAGLIVSVDRQERGQGEASALTELSAEFCMPTFAIVTVQEIMQHLHGRELDAGVVIDDACLAAMQAYRAEYGAC